MGWRDGSIVKGTDCSSRGPGINSQHPFGGLQLSFPGTPHPYVSKTPMNNK